MTQTSTDRAVQRDYRMRAAARTLEPRPVDPRWAAFCETVEERIAEIRRQEGFGRSGAPLLPLAPVLTAPAPTLPPRPPTAPPAAPPAVVREVICQRCGKPTWPLAMYDGRLCRLCARARRAQWSGS